MELRAEPGREPSRMLYVPEGFAHGFLTLEDDTEVFYQMSEFYAPAGRRGDSAGTTRRLRSRGRSRCASSPTAIAAIRISSDARPQVAS